MNERTSVSSPGAKLFVEHWGSGGSTLILGHGFGGSARNFRPQAKVFSTKRRVTLFDARGHARSEAPREASEYRPERFVGDLATLVSSVTAQNVVLGGLSMGAGLALRFALSHPERVRALVLASFPRSADQPGHVEWARSFADAIEREGLEAAGARFAWAERARFDPKGADLIRRGFLEHPPYALAHILRELLALQPSPQSMAAELRELRIPTLVVAGSEDPTSLANCQALSELLPEAELVVVPGGGHVVNLTSPADFNRALDGFLARLEDRG